MVPRWFYSRKSCRNGVLGLRWSWFEGSRGRQRRRFVLGSLGLRLFRCGIVGTRGGGCRRAYPLGIFLGVLDLNGLVGREVVWESHGGYTCVICPGKLPFGGANAAQ